jgi:uncharacterized protein
MLYIYLHGFNSAYDPEAQKVRELASIGEVTGITYDSFGTYQEIFEEISSQVPEDRDDVVFVGTSLGGFWAAEMARHFGTPSVIINPCHDPYSMLRKYVGTLQTNYYTAETNVLTNEIVETYPTYGMTGEDRTFAFLPLVLLDMADEVIDSYETIEVLEGFPTRSWAGGSHRFDHMAEAVTEVSSYVNICTLVDHMNS